MGILIVALANFIVGSILGPSGVDELSKGMVGYNCKENLMITKSSFTFLIENNILCI